MKSLLRFALVVIAVLPVVALGQTNGVVLSRNAVGYTYVILEPGQEALLTVPFESLVGVATPEAMLGNQLIPDGTTIYFWSPVEQCYTAEELIDFGDGTRQWFPNEHVFRRGEGFWLKVPASASAGSYVFLMMGEVPDAFTAPVTSVAVPPGMSLLGYPYPVRAELSKTALAGSVGTGDVVWTYQPGAGYERNEFNGTGWSNTNLVLEAGRGFWYLRRGSATMWTEAKPYTWP